jgi:hypothetical protein
MAMPTLDSELRTHVAHSGMARLSYSPTTMGGQLTDCHTPQKLATPIISQLYEYAHSPGGALLPLGVPYRGRTGGQPGVGVVHAQVQSVLPSYSAIEEHSHAPCG